MKPSFRDAVTADELRRTAAACRAALVPAIDSDWERLAGDLEWSCRDTLVHALSTLTYYAVNLATRSSEPRPSGQTNQSLPIEELLEALEGRAAVLAVVCESALPEARGAHDFGPSDAEGFAAMGCDEMIIHTADIATGLHVEFEPPRDVCAHVLARLFPWMPRDADPWASLRWANGRAALGGRGRLAPNWIWQSAPVAEWDGVDPTT